MLHGEPEGPPCVLLQAVSVPARWENIYSGARVLLPLCFLTICKSSWVEDSFRVSPGRDHSAAAGLARFFAGSLSHAYMPTVGARGQTDLREVRAGYSRAISDPTHHPGRAAAGPNRGSAVVRTVKEMPNYANQVLLSMF